ncbi:MAG: hypothetical protein Q8Q25_00475 [bacterium]|nr:hypothetical protein [bacterium]
MKKILLCLSFIFCVSHAMDFNTLLNKPKIGIIDQTAYGFPSEFQLNLKENKNTLSTKITPYGNLGLYDHIPAIGFYQTPYLFAVRLALIELDQNMLEHALPTTLKQALICNLATTSLQSIITSKTIYSHIMISGHIPEKNTYNLVFHPFACSFIQKLLFNINMPMGVFYPNGITTTSNATSFESLSQQNVNAHNGIDLAFSPNNARIGIAANRSVSTFWSAAHSPNKQFVTITYHIMANNQPTQIAFENIIQNAANLGDLLNSMEAIKKTLANAADKNALDNAIDTIRTILKWQEHQQVAEL